jgi:hypothetical protein
MFEEYLQDSHMFISQANKQTVEGDARRYYRASVFCAAGALEAFMNYMIDSLVAGNRLSDIEKVFLTDKAFTFENGKLDEKNEFHSLEAKLKVLIRKVSPRFDFGTATWCKLMEFKELRDLLIHPKKDEDETEISEYRQKVNDGLKSIICIMGSINKGTFGKSLRKQITDLIPD